MTNFDILWSRYDDKFKCLIGNLNYDGIWHFTYDEEGVDFATQLGFVGFPEFPEITKTYESNMLFSTFATRIHNASNTITESEKINLLHHGNGVLITDNIEIVEDRVKSEGRQKTYGTN